MDGIDWVTQDLSIMEMFTRLPVNFVTVGGGATIRNMAASLH